MKKLGSILISSAQILASAIVTVVFAAYQVDSKFDRIETKVDTMSDKLTTSMATLTTKSLEQDGRLYIIHQRMDNTEQVVSDHEKQLREIKRGI